MKKFGIKAKRRRKFRHTTDSTHKLPVAPNLLSRKFNPCEPNKTWASDISYVWTKQGWLYLAVTMDLYSRKIVGWSLQEHMKKDLVIDALKMGLSRRKMAPGALHHSDRGSQYASDAFQALLSDNHITASMSRKGECYDNAVVESFSTVLKVSSSLKTLRQKPRLKLKYSNL